MELRRALFFKINNMNCEFRTINETDVSQDYVNGLRKQTEYIENIPAEVSISKQKNYIKNVLSSEGNTICGLFINEALVGTSGVQSSIKFLQYIDAPAEYVSTIGIFVFNSSYRGKGLGKTLVWASTYLYHKCTSAVWFGAGMSRENISSANSFTSCGYRIVRDNEENYKVVLNISKLIKPYFIVYDELHRI